MADPFPGRSKRPCPICRKPAVPKYHPFCSTRCARIDLGRWLGGNYAIPEENPSEYPEMTNDPPQDIDT